MGPGVKIDTSHTTAGDVLAAAAGFVPTAETNGRGAAAAKEAAAAAITREAEQELEQISAADSPFEVEDPDAE